MKIADNNSIRANKKGIQNCLLCCALCFSIVFPHTLKVFILSLLVFITLYVYTLMDVLRGIRLLNRLSKENFASLQEERDNIKRVNAFSYAVVVGWAVCIILMVFLHSNLWLELLK
jgi:hypothetical protein